MYTLFLMTQVPLSIVVLDTETTGFIPGPHKMIEYAMIRMENGKTVDAFEQLFSVEDDLPPHVQILTRIRPQDLQGKPTFAQQRDDIARRLEGDVLMVGQNLGFDLGFLKKEGIDCTDRPWIDTSMLASLVFPECASFSLGYLSEVLELPHAPKHRALGDVRATLGLLQKIWERLLELPEAQLTVAKDIMRRAPEGYQIFFDALPASTAKKCPEWFCCRSRPPVPHSGRCRAIDPPPLKTIDLVEDTLAPDGLGCVMAAAADDANVRRWIGVKNLPTCLRRFTPPEGVITAWAPWQLPDNDAVERLMAQDSFTADEATLAVKLAWFAPDNRDAVALHGGEKDVWSGKIACTDASPAYRKQFQQPARAIVLDHRHLLSLTADDALPIGPSAEDHVIIDDASMLEDTATKAYGVSLSLDDLRAASQGDERLTRIADIAELWANKVRSDTDQRMIVHADLSMRETKGLSDLIAEIADDPAIPHRTRELLRDLLRFIDPEGLGGSIAWIELKPNGGQLLQRVPDLIGAFLSEKLYARVPTTLLAPPRWPLTEVLPKSIPTRDAPFRPPEHPPIALSFAEDMPLETVLRDPPAGRTVALMGSKRLIEAAFIRWTEPLEAQGVTLICQGFSGGQGRMESEFLASPHAILLMTPWMYEGSDLPPDSVDHLLLDTLPFDHPGHPVVHHRAERYGNGFTEYSMPRLMHRLFRLLRTFARHRTQQGEVIVLDNRIRTKTYGATVKQELMKLCRTDEDAPPVDRPVQEQLL